MTLEELESHSVATEKLAKIHNQIFEQTKVLISAQGQVLPYFIKKNLEPALIQPDWILNHEFNTLNQNQLRNHQEKLFRIFCGQGKVANLKSIEGKSIWIHHQDPYLKLGPFQVEIITFQPYRSLIHNLFYNNSDLEWMMNHSRPHLTKLRELELAKQVFNESIGDSNKRKFIMKTVQTWFNDVQFDWNSSNENIFPHLKKLTKRLELATQLIINGKSTASTEYQVTQYGLGGLCETHIDPYGYIEGAGLYEDPNVQRLKETGDIFATLMGYLNHVQAGGSTAFCQLGKEEIIDPKQGSVAFWWSLDSKGHRLSETLHGGCPVLEGSKWIFNKWIYYFDQWKRFPCGLHSADVFPPPPPQLHHY